MSSKDLFAVDRVIIDLHVTGLKQLFQDVSACLIENAAKEGVSLSKSDIINAALERERLGSTGVGNGVAVPHARISGIERVMTVFARLETPLEFNAVDDRPVDLVAFILAPIDAGSAHLRVLATISRLLRGQETRQRLRAAPTAEAIFAILSETQQVSAA